MLIVTKIDKNFNFKDDWNAQSSTTLFFLPVSTRRLLARLAGQNNANDGEWYFYVISGSLKNVHYIIIIQGCALKKIKGSPVLLISETIGAQHVICMKKTFLVAQEQKLGTRGHRVLLLLSESYNPLWVSDNYYIINVNKLNEVYIPSNSNHSSRRVVTKISIQR